MASPVTLRLDKDTRQRVARIARWRRVSVSAVIREAIETWVEEPTVTPYELVADLIGVETGGIRAKSRGDSATRSG